MPNRDELGALVADLNRMSAEVGRLYGELEAASQHKSEFLANMSHELRTPLNAVIGFSEVLREKMFGELNDKQAEYVQDIHASGRHLLSLINDILDLSKIEAGKVELELSEFDLPNTIDGTLTLVRERAARHGLEMGLSLDDRLGTIVADERKVRQILLNLLSNAVKFTADGGRIDVGAGLRDGAIEISVSDTGVGIAPEDHEAIFEEFRQVGGDHAGKREGTGLGLTLARKFVELHGGRIWLESTVGKGSTFTFTLPVGTAAPHPAVATSRQRIGEPMTRHSTVRSGPASNEDGAMSAELILIVEDQPLNRKLVRDVLQAKGYRTVETETAEEGLRVALDQRPALILMDIQLPGINGIEALKRLRADPATRAIPIIAVTASAMQQNRKEILEAGFDGYQPKPINVSAFLKAVRETLDGRPEGLAHLRAMESASPSIASGTTA